MRHGDLAFLTVAVLAVLGAFVVGAHEAAQAPFGEAGAARFVGGSFPGRLHEGIDPLRPPGLPEGASIDPTTGRLMGLRASDGAGVRGLAWEDLTLPEGFRDPATLPDGPKGLVGERVALIGFVSPTFEVEAFRHFFLVASTFACCYGRPPGLDGIVEVRLAADARPLDMDPRPHVVTGTLRIEPLFLTKAADAPLVLLYHLSDARAVALGDS